MAVRFISDVPQTINGGLNSGSFWRVPIIEFRLFLKPETWRLTFAGEKLTDHRIGRAVLSTATILMLCADLFRLLS
jgi:hypothetical protein